LETYADEIQPMLVAVERDAIHMGQGGSMAET
jgi:hypothetical protein